MTRKMSSNLMKAVMVILVISFFISCTTNSPQEINESTNKSLELELSKPADLSNEQIEDKMSTGYVTVNDQELYYEVHGKGDPLILICGLSMDLTAHMAYLPILSEQFQVIIFDNRDAGRSSKAKSPYTIADMAEDTVGLMDALGLESAHVLGGSMGGAIAQELAIRYPDRVNKLILSATISKATLTLDSFTTLMKFIKKHDQNNEIIPLMTLLTTMTVNFSENEEMVKQIIGMSKNPPYPQSFDALARQVEAIIGFDALDRLPMIKAPTLVLAADQDILTPPSEARKIEAAIPGAELQILEGGGHGFMFEISEKSNKAIIEFLNK